MNKKYTRLVVTAVIAALAVLVLLAGWYLQSHNVAVLNPKGTIASQQQRLIILATSLMALVVVPVFAMTIIIAWRYREGNTKATYSPELGGNRWVELTWWLIPLLIIGVLAVVAWTSSRDLDPFRPLASSAKPVHIQVVALQWKWLFIYPEQHVASVNFVQLPVNTPVDFDITADAPMNSFWIPQLGGQIYAMPGMSTQLHLMAEQPGDYHGSSANISGTGFAGMTFTARGSSAHDFDQWVATAQKSSTQLTPISYAELAKPSQNVPAATYSFPSNAAGLYDTVIMKYMAPSGR